MTMHRAIAALVFSALLAGPHPVMSRETNVVRGADELFWVPTLEQALDMAKATGRPIFVMGYSLVDNGTTYTKIDSDYCTGVF
jgi:hypothetical protein